jgi:2-dehydro-3-deoxyphosphogluconate aldolase/(4S)-4-hydroxy-2-oxoglutarate aldolase
MSGLMHDTLRRLRLVPLIVIDDPGHAEPLGAALLEGGLPCAEVAFRTPRSLDALRRMASAHGDLLVGAGTVLSATQAAEALDAGARFIVAPGFDPAVVDFCRERGVPVFPGACTPTEIGAARARGLSVVKFFPAEPMGGLRVLKAVSAPFFDMEFMPTGGIGVDNVRDYLAFDRVLACGGSWMAPQQWIAGGDFARIRDEVRRAVQLAQPKTGAPPS